MRNPAVEYNVAAFSELSTAACRWVQVHSQALSICPLYHGCLLFRGVH